VAVNPFAELYDAAKHPTDLPTPLAAFHSPPKRFIHSECTLIATVPAEEDGQEARIYETRMPASFFRVEIKAGAGKPGWRMTTGSGSEMAWLAGEVALAASQGMIHVKEVEPA
jgi:hypothetical protein